MPDSVDAAGAARIPGSGTGQVPVPPSDPGIAGVPPSGFVWAPPAPDAPTAGVVRTGPLRPPPRLNPSGPAAPPSTWDPSTRSPAWLPGQGSAPAPLSSVPRPTFREPLPVRAGAVAASAAVTALWMALVALLAGTVRSYGWLTILAASVAWITAAVLARYGDRGAAAGVAVTGGVGLSVAALVIIAHWAGGTWPLW